MKLAFSRFLVGLACLSIGAVGNSAVTDISDAPLVTSSTSSVHSNLMFILDDSGSMDSNYLPDWANTSTPYLFRNVAYNGNYYDPAVRYLPPAYFTSAGLADTVTYPSMTGVSTATGGDSAASVGSPNWKDVPRDKYGVQSSSEDNLEGNAYFYTLIPGEYCSSKNLRTCVAASAPTASYSYPAKLRWCTGSGLGTCKAVRQTGWTNARYQVPYQATITVSGGVLTTVSSILVDGQQILSGTTTGSTSSDTVAQRIRDNINNCSNRLTGACTIAGYVATSSGSVVTISAPSNTTVTPVITKSGAMTVTPTAFSAQPVPGSSPNVTLPQGANIRTTIHPDLNSYPYPGSASKASTRTDCAGATCTYREEMTNYANWYAYYRTRMQMMKTAASIAFSSYGETYDDVTATLINKKPMRIGFFTILAKGVNSTGTNFLDIDNFSFPHKKNWYDKLFAGEPSGWTPLRGALSKAGQYYAKKLSGQAVDPVQYSCQRNVTLLSTDGYWNDNAEESWYGPKQLNNSTNVGNQDGSDPRPYNDGGNSTVTETTPTTTVSRDQEVTETTTTKTYRRYVYSWGPNGTDGCNASRHRRRNQEQRYTQTIVETTTKIVDTATVSTRTVVTTNGVVTSDTTSENTGATTVDSQTVEDSNTQTAWADYGSYTTSGSCTTSYSGLPNPNPSNPVLLSTASVVTAGPAITNISVTGPTVGATTTSTSSSGGTSNTLADVAAYYYKTDLRTAALGNCDGVPVGAPATAQDVCVNDVKASANDSASWQHMTTFTLALGVDGLMQYEQGYQTAVSGDFYDLGTVSRGEATASSASGTCTWLSNGSKCTWPAPSSGAQSTIDDLWHAAVNGRGQYFSATDPASLSTSLTDALNSIDQDTGASAAATTSNPNITSGDNFVFESTFTEGDWYGELVRKRLDLITGEVAPTIDWRLSTLLDAKTWSARSIYTFDSAAGNKLKAFTWANLSLGERANFELAKLTSVAGLTQFCAAGVSCLPVPTQTAAAGEPLVNFIRGDRVNEGAPTDTSKAFRSRAHVLGDIVNAEAVYVKGPLKSYSDPGFAAHKTAMAGRTGMVYLASNDGMLHAIDAADGDEKWAYIPAQLIPELYQLADKNYKNQHRFFADGTPSVGEICVSNCANAGAAVWKTILVAGFNKGGRGYYALDITDPAAPAALWEFTDVNMGYTYGNPVITKLADGTWVVAVTSGYNNVSPGDGEGRLYLLNASTGTPVRTISTGAGDTTTPSGLAKISAWVDYPNTDNTAARIYGGDLLGNLWRFDINDAIAPTGYEAHRLVTFEDASAPPKAQPITTAPQLAEVETFPVVYVGTGSYLGASDLSNVNTQSFYAIKDKLDATTYSSPRLVSSIVKQTLTDSVCPAGQEFCNLGETVRTSSNLPVDWAVNDGWFFDLPSSGERNNTDPQLALGTLVFTTNIPGASVCSAGGTSFLYFVDYRTGGSVDGSGGYMALGLAGLATRPVFAQLPSGEMKVLVRLADGTTPSRDVPIQPPKGITRRISWRELVD